MKASWVAAIVSLFVGTSISGAAQPPEPDAALRENMLLGAVLLYVSQGHRPFKLAAFTPTYFVQEGKRFPTLTFELQGSRVVAVHLRESEGWMRYRRLESPEP